MAAEWFSVDRNGLAKQLADTPTWRLLAELLQNAWDEKSTRVTMAVCRALVRGYYQVEVTDDNPDGFKDLTHAWTLFAPSTKAGNAEQRGRFNMGEKMLLAVAREAKIRTTKGMVTFDDRGRRVSTRANDCTISGSSVTVVMKIKDLDDVAKNLQRLVAPLPTHIQIEDGNAILVQRMLRQPDTETVREIAAALPTVIANADGELTRTVRNTTVRLYPATDEHPAAIYEMGIPVVDVDLPWVVDVQQKVPLNRDRDNVTPAYLQQLRVLVFNAMHDDMTATDFSSDWARAAAGDDDADQAAVTASLDNRFGKDRVAFDPSDPEANRIAVTKGYTVVSGGSMSKGEWTNARATTKPAGQVTPSPKPFHPDGDPLTWAENITDDMVAVQRVVNALALAAFGYPVGTRFADDPHWRFSGACGPSTGVILNVADKPGRERWFNLRTNLIGVMNLVIHELGHIDGSSHLSEAYYDNLTKVGATAVNLMRVQPDLFTDLHTK